MADYCQCLRCSKRIPIRPEMIGQTILCPSCLERVYVTPASDPAPEKPKPAVNTGSAEPTMSPSAETALARLKAPAEETRSLPIGLIAGLGGVAALVIIGGLVMWASKPAKKPGQQAALPGAPLPPPPPTVETTEPQPSSTPAKPSYGELSPEFKPARPPGFPTPSYGELSPEFKTARPPGSAVPPTAAFNNPSNPSPGTQPATAPGVSAPAGSASPVSLTAQPQSLGANWAEVWRSPATLSSEPAALVSVAETPTPWRIAVRSAAPDLRTVQSVIVEPDSDPRSWMLKYLPNPQAIAEKESVAMLKQDGPNLVFAWATPSASDQARRHAMNCVLEVSAGSVRRVGQLREPIRMEPISLDLAAEKQTIEAQINDPPRADALRLEITELSGFPSEMKLKGGVKTAMVPPAQGAMPAPFPGAPFGGAPTPGAPRPAVPSPGIPPQGMMPMSGLATPFGQPAGAQTLVIECEEIPGLEIRVKLARAESTGKLTISIDPVLHEGPKAEFDLATPNILDRLEAEVQKPLISAQRDLEPAQKSLKRWLDDEEKLKSNEPRTKDAQRYAKWRANVQDSANWAREFGTKVDDLKQKIESYQTRIEVVTKLRTFLKDAHKQAQVHYVVYSECGQPDVLLIDARGQR